MVLSLPKGLSERDLKLSSQEKHKLLGGLGLGERLGRRQLWRPGSSHLLRALPEEELQGPAPKIRAMSGVLGF